MQVFEMEKAKIGMCVNPEMRNCEKQLLPEGLGEHKERTRIRFLLGPEYGSTEVRPPPQWPILQK